MAPTKPSQEKTGPDFWRLSGGGSGMKGAEGPEAVRFPKVRPRASLPLQMHPHPTPSPRHAQEMPGTLNSHGSSTKDKATGWSGLKCQTTSWSFGPEAHHYGRTSRASGHGYSPTSQILYLPGAWYYKFTC